MRKHSMVAAVLVTTMAAGEAARAARAARAAPRETSDHVKVCQVGYLIAETKFAMLTAEPAGASAVLRRAADDGEALVVSIGSPVKDPSSGDTVRAINFSALRDPGTYYL